MRVLMILLGLLNLVMAGWNAVIVINRIATDTVTWVTPLNTFAGVFALAVGIWCFFVAFDD